MSRQELLSSWVSTLCSYSLLSPGSMPWLLDQEGTVLSPHCFAARCPQPLWVTAALVHELKEVTVANFWGMWVMSQWVQWNLRKSLKFIVTHHSLLKFIGPSLLPTHPAPEVCLALVSHGLSLTPFMPPIFSRHSLFLFFVLSILSLSPFILQKFISVFVMASPSNLCPENYAFYP